MGNALKMKLKRLLAQRALTTTAHFCRVRNFFLPEFSKVGAKREGPLAGMVVLNNVRELGERTTNGIRLVHLAGVRTVLIAFYQSYLNDVAMVVPRKLCLIYCLDWSYMCEQ